MSILTSTPAPVQHTLTDADFRAWLRREAAAELEGYRPEPAPFVPTATQDAFYVAFTLVMDGEDPAIPEGLSPRLARSFEAGMAAARNTLDREYRTWLDSIDAADHTAGDPYDNLSDAELLEMRGSRYRGLDD